MLIASPVISRMSGSMAGITGSRNRYGMYLRSKALPVNPNTSLQQLIRGYFAAASNAWAATLTVAQRAAWTVYAEAVTVKNSLGDNTVLSGNAMFARCNVPRLQAGKAIVADAPTSMLDAILTPPVSTVIEPGIAGDLSIAFTNTDDWATAVGGGLNVYAGPPLAPSIGFYKGPYKYLGTIAGALVPPTSPNTVFQYNTLGWGPLTATLKLPLRYRAFNSTGEVSTSTSELIIIGS